VSFAFPASRKGSYVKQKGLFLVIAVLALTVLPASGAAVQRDRSTSANYLFFLTEPSVAQASSGDTLSLLGENAHGGHAVFTFGVQPKSATGDGQFVYTAAAGDRFEGTWTVDRLVDFQPYGCGSLSGEPVAPFLCGGRLRLHVTMTTPSGPLEGDFTFFSLVGSPPPDTQGGATMVVPHLGNFNRQLEGRNDFRSSP
jgi:hypothetical protein